VSCNERSNTILCRWLLAVGHWRLVVGWLLAVDCWLLAVVCWLLAVGCWFIGCWLAGCWLLAVGRPVAAWCDVDPRAARCRCCRAKTAEYSALIKAQDAEGLMALLTDVGVERKVVERVRLKAATFGQDINQVEDTSDGGWSMCWW
jgi:hypothetical protein